MYSNHQYGGQTTKLAMLQGRLFQSGDPPALYLEVPAKLVQGHFAALVEFGVELPKDISHVFEVMKASEVARHEQIIERGMPFSYNVGKVVKYPAPKNSEFSSDFYLSVSSPELARLRISYGFNSQPLGGFGILIARRRKNIFRPTAT